ncbi:hypothetical protein J4Q44_G00318090, partial [Coregonus suidteri]
MECWGISTCNYWNLTPASASLLPPPSCFPLPDLPFGLTTDTRTLRYHSCSEPGSVTLPVNLDLLFPYFWKPGQLHVVNKP